MTAKIIAEKLAAKTKNSKVLTRHFSYDTTYVATLVKEPITVERVVDDKFTKYVNNDENPCQRVLGKSFYSSKQRLWCIFLMKQATKNFCWLICKWLIIIYTI